MNIEEFYKTNTIDKDFNYLFYASHYPEVRTFYQPYCDIHSIDDNYRLFFHYSMYGMKDGFVKNISDFIQTKTKGIIFNQINHTETSIEDFWPVHANFTQQYSDKNLIGKNIAKISRIAVVGLARNCEKNIKKSISNILSLNNRELKVFIYENDSIDSTKKILQETKQSNSNIDISLNNHNTEYLTGLCATRTNNLAKYRNICKEWVEKNCHNFDYTIVIDLDADLGFSIDGIYNSIAWLDTIKNAGGMGSYSLYLSITEHSAEFAHYDSFAVRLNDWEPADGYDNHNIWFRNLHPLVGSDPIPMYSCFGGLCVYKNDAFLGGIYDGSIGSEHILFHKSIKEHGYDLYLNPSSRFFSVYNNKLL